MGCPFFGEINEPNSRAFWDDFDENESVNTVSFSWEYINKNAIENQEIEELLLIEGESISNVVDGILMKPSDFELFAVLNPSQALKMYKNANKLICVYNRRDILDSGSILNEVMQFLNIPKVITISIHSKAQYKTENLREIEESFTILKGLNSEVDYAKELKCPNFIVGLSGGVISWRQANNMRTHTYVVYVDGSLDRMTSKTLTKLFSDIGYKIEVLSDKFRSSSYLYM